MLPFACTLSKASFKCKHESSELVAGTGIAGRICSSPGHVCSVLARTETLLQMDSAVYVSLTGQDGLQVHPCCSSMRACPVAAGPSLHALASTLTPSHMPPARSTFHTGRALAACFWAVLGRSMGLVFPWVSEWDCGPRVAKLRRPAVLPFLPEAEHPAGASRVFVPMRPGGSRGESSLQLTPLPPPRGSALTAALPQSRKPGPHGQRDI